MNKDNGSLLGLPLEDIMKKQREVVVSPAGRLSIAYRDDDGVAYPVEEWARAGFYSGAGVSFVGREVRRFSEEKGNRVDAFLNAYGAKLAEAVGESFDEYAGYVLDNLRIPNKTDAPIVARMRGRTEIKYTIYASPFFVDPRISLVQLDEIFGPSFLRDWKSELAEIQDFQKTGEKPYIAHGYAELPVTAYLDADMLSSGKMRDATFQESVFLSKQGPALGADVYALGSRSPRGVPGLSCEDRQGIGLTFASPGSFRIPALTRQVPPGYVCIVTK